MSQASVVLEGENLDLPSVRVFFRQFDAFEVVSIHSPCGFELLGLRRLISFPPINRALLLLLELKITISS
jgi:hypothetical protein